MFEACGQESEWKWKLWRTALAHLGAISVLLCAGELPWAYAVWVMSIVTGLYGPNGLSLGGQIVVHILDWAPPVMALALGAAALTRGPGLLNRILGLLGMLGGLAWSIHLGVAFVRWYWR